MIAKEYTVLAPEGLHARPAKAFLKLLKKYGSKVMIKKDDIECDAKSMLGILSMQATYNSKIIVEIDGEDETELAASLDQFFAHDIINL